MPSDTGEPGPGVSTELKEACSILLCEIIEDITLEICFKIHRAFRFDYLPIDEYIIQDGKFILHNSTSADQNHDLLALAASSKKPSHINCPHCKRKLGTNRFAPHLNSCMGEGGRQNKDRNAKRNCQTYESGDDDDDEDYSDSGKKKKKKAGKNSRKVNKVKGKSGDNFASAGFGKDRVEAPMKRNEENHGAERLGVQINVFLSQKCGVISRKLKSMCNNTLKCSIHSDEQRREIRRSLLKCEPDSNVHIDVDTVDEGSRSPSPSDLSVCSSSNSTLSVKLEDVCSTPEHPRLTPSTYP